MYIDVHTISVLMMNTKDDNNCKCEDKSIEIPTFYVMNMIKDLPTDLLGIFVPLDKEGLIQLEMNIVRWVSREKEREKVVQLQRMHGLPFRPNQSLRDVIIRLKILDLKLRNEQYQDDADAPSSDIDLDNH